MRHLCFGERQKQIFKNTHFHLRGCRNVRKAGSQNGKRVWATLKPLSVLVTTAHSGGCAPRAAAFHPPQPCPFHRVRARSLGKQNVLVKALCRVILPRCTIYDVLMRLIGNRSRGNRKEVKKQTPLLLLLKNPKKSEFFLSKWYFRQSCVKKKGGWGRDLKPWMLLGWLLF